MKRKIITVLSALVLAATLGGSVLIIYTYTKGFHSFARAYERISFWQWAAIAAAVALYVSFDYARLYTLLRVLGHRLGFLTNLKITSVSEFAEVVTPSPAMNIPAVVYLLRREGVPTAQGSAAVGTKIAYTMAWIVVFSLSTSLLNTGYPLPPEITEYWYYYLIPLLLILVSLGSLILCAGHIHRACQACARDERRHRLVRLLVTWIDHTARAVVDIGHSTAPMHLLSHVAAIGFICAYSLVGYLLANAMYIHLSYFDALTVFSNSLIAVYFTPIPGGIGVTEYLTAKLLEPRAQPEDGMLAAMVVAVVLRLVTKYMFILPGSVIVTHIVRREGLKYLKVEETT